MLTKRCIKLISKHKYLILILILALLLRFPWLYATIERDEGIFGFTTVQFLSGISIYSIDNKPPLIYILYALPITIFGNSIIPIRLFNNSLFFISIVFFFSLIKRLYGEKIAVLSSIFYILFMNIPAFEGPLAVTESFMIPFFVTSLYFLNLFQEKQNHFHLGLSIILMYLASLIRHNALGGLLLIYFLIFKQKKFDYKKVLLLSIPLILFLSLLNYFIYTNQTLYILRKLLHIDTIIPFEYILLAILESSFILIFTFIGVVNILRNKQTKKYSLILLWLLFLIPFLFFPRSFHHLLTLVPPLSVFAGIGFSIFLKNKKEKSVIIILVLLIIFSLFLITKQYPDYHFKIKNIIIDYADLNNYEKQVELSNHIKDITSPKDKILVWGSDPGTYWLSERKSVLLEFGSTLNCENVKRRLRQNNYSFNNPEVFIIHNPDSTEDCNEDFLEIFKNQFLYYNKSRFKGIEIYRRNK